MQKHITHFLVFKVAIYMYIYTIYMFNIKCIQAASEKAFIL